MNKRNKSCLQVKVLLVSMDYYLIDYLQLLKPEVKPHFTKKNITHVVEIL